MGASEIFSLNVSKDFWQSELQLNSQSFVSNLKNGDVISVSLDDGLSWKSKTSG